MEKASEVATDPVKTVVALSISPIVDDHLMLQGIFAHSDVQPKWSIQPVSSLVAALPILRENQASIVLAERELSPGTWRDVLDEIGTLPDPPLLIVTSRLADEHLWAEALNLGAFDVLAKPFQASEVTRTLALAWRHWQDRHGVHCERTKQRATAGAAYSFGLFGERNEGSDSAR
jgi:DNA-binding response OmpR family regulator